MHENERRTFNQVIDDQISAAEDLAAAGAYRDALYKTISAIQDLTRYVNRLSKEAPLG